MRWLVGVLIAVLMMGCTARPVPMRWVPDTRAIRDVQIDSAVVEELKALYQRSGQTQLEQALCLHGYAIDSVMVIESVSPPLNVRYQTWRTVGFDCRDDAIGFAHTHPLPSAPSHEDVLLQQMDGKYAVMLAVDAVNHTWVVLRETQLGQMYW